MSAVRNEGVPAALAPARRPGLGAVAAAWAPVAIWVAVIFSLSGDQFSEVNTAAWLSGLPVVGAIWGPPTALEAGNFIVRKCAHFVEYAVLSMLIFRALRHTVRGQAGRQLLAGAVAVSIACASLDELHQYLWTRNRTGTPKDVVLDTVGAFAGAVVGATYLYRRITRRAA